MILFFLFRVRFYVCQLSSFPKAAKFLPVTLKAQDSFLETTTVEQKQMIDNEADFSDILDAQEEVQAIPKFRPKQRVKPRKATLSTRSVVLNLTAEIRDEKAGALTEGNSSQELFSQGRASLSCLGSETVDVAGSQGIIDKLSEDIATVPLGSLTNCSAPWDSATDGVSAVDRVSQDDQHGDDLSKLAAHQDSLVTSDIQVSPASSCGKTIDDIVEFGGMFDARAKEDRVAKLQPKVQVKPLKAASISPKTNQKVEGYTVDKVTQNDEGDNNERGRHDDVVQSPRSHEMLQSLDSEAVLATDHSTVDDLANLDNVLGNPDQEEAAANFHLKLQSNPSKASSRVAGTKANVASATPVVGICTVDVVFQDKGDDSQRDHNRDTSTKSVDQETLTGPATWSPQDVHATVDLDSHNELMVPHAYGTQSKLGEVSAEPTIKSPLNVGREKGKGESVSFVLPDASEGFSRTDINFKMGNLSYSCNEALTDGNLNNPPRQTADKERTDKVSQSHERDPSDVRETGSSMKLRSRKKLLKVGIPEHSADDCFDEDNLELSAADQDSGSCDDYTTGGKRKVRRKSKDGINEEPPSDLMSIEETQQHKVGKDKNQVSSRGRKRTLKDPVTEKPEKKLTHRIRQKRMQEVRNLLETPDKIDHMKLTATHLRLLQEVREGVKGKEVTSGPSFNTCNSKNDDLDDSNPYGEEEHDFHDDRTENNAIQNATKLNYHSYMNKQTRAKWSKSDTDLFYQGLRQFGSDFAMIQQLFPDKTRHQIRQKFKTEDKKNPMLVHDAIIHRSGDNLYFKKVIKQLNIEDVVPESNSTHKKEDASNERGPGNEDAMEDFVNGEEENGSSWSDKEHGMHSSDVQEHFSGNADDDLGDVFDWY
ncbi:hypothetical protein ACP70R_026594 [Stipagrostis hirtigluma subsp. patula]